MNDKDKYCPHCLPVKKENHIIDYIDYAVDKISSWFSGILLKITPHKSYNFLSKKFHHWMIRLLHFFGLIKYDSNPDRSKLRNRLLIFFDKAKKKGFDISAIKVGGRYNAKFKLNVAGNTYFYSGNPIKLCSPAEQHTRNKKEIKKLLANHDLPLPKGKCCMTYRQAFQTAQQVGYPLITKPATSSRSRHLTLDINNKEELKQGYEIAKKLSPEVIIEQFIPGKLHRGSVIDQKEVFVCQKEKPNIVGDGSSTILELIKQKNQDPKRGGVDQKNTTLHKIPINQKLKEKLNKQNIDLNYIPTQGEKVYLHNKDTLSQGCDIIAKTDQTHPKNKQMFLEVAEVLNTNLIGVDFICQDITKPYTDQKCGIIETNFFPYIDMHQFLSQGKPDPVAEITWNLVLQKIAPKAEK